VSAQLEVTPSAAARSLDAVERERCLRCSAEMEWRHGTWQCARCRFKLGCCEGEPQTCADASSVGASLAGSYSATVGSVSSGESSRSR
jgi:hypothetical protein